MSFSRQPLLVLATAAVGVAMPLIGSTAPGPTVIFVDDDNCPGPGTGTELDPYCSIQTAIENAVDTDEIVVAPGTYFETINFLGKAITLRSLNGPDVTVIDAQLTGSVVTCNSLEGTDTVLDGFTITGGSASHGGGMFNIGSNPTVTNCTFSGNMAAIRGGGMYNLSSNPKVTGCTFSGNSGSTGGGGMYNALSTNPTVTNCTFSRNNTGRLGGGMLNASSSPTVSNCTFSGNTADVGGGMYNTDPSSPTVTNCTFRQNVARGGGGMGNSNSSPTVTNCTFALNSAANGRALAFDSCCFSGNLIMANCILWDGGDEIANLNKSTLTITYTNVQGTWPGIGNIDADPLFVDPVNGDLHLQPGSVCIDAGHNWAIAGITATDLDGNSRFVHARVSSHPGCGVPAVVDMGAYEFPKGRAADIKLGDIDGNGTVGMFDLVSLVISWGPAGSGCQLADFDLDGKVAVPDLLRLLTNWG